MTTINLDKKFGRKQLSWTERFDAADAYREEIRTTSK